MKCRVRPKHKTKMTRDERIFLNQMTSRYLKLRMTMSHEKAIEQLKREAEDAGLANKNTEDNGAVHEAGSDNVEE